MFNPIGSKATVAVFAPLSEHIITGHESGKVALFETKSGEEVQSNEKAHNGQVTDLQLSTDGTYFVTSSKDKSARLHRTQDLVVLKTFTTNTPLNSASITPVRPYVILGGGQDAASVTTTSQRQGKFEARFWHRVFEEEVGRVRGHFGPLNTVAVHPSGKAFASGGEDGYIRLHWVRSSLPFFCSLSLSFSSGRLWLTALPSPWETLSRSSLTRATSEAGLSETSSPRRTKVSTSFYIAKLGRSRARGERIRQDREGVGGGSFLTLTEGFRCAFHISFHSPSARFGSVPTLARMCSPVRAVV